jgi:hypothetical protein
MVGQSVPVTGISLGVAEATGVAEAVAVDVGVAEAVDVGVAEAVAVGVSVAKGVGVLVGVGEAEAHKVKSVVQDAPSEEQQKFTVPHGAICRTFSVFEQLISCGEPSSFAGLQFLSKSGCPETGQASAAGQILPEAFSLIFCCCLTKSTPATTVNTKNTTMQIVITIARLLLLPDFLLVTVSKGETDGF